MNARTKIELSQRVKVWTDTVHYGDGTGRPACGSARRTHISWIHETDERVNCQRCISMYGMDVTARA